MIEEVIAGIKAKLVEGLSAQLVIIKGQMGDAISLEEFQDKDIHLTEKGSYQNFPTIVLVGDRTPTTYLQNAKNDLHFIILSCAITHTNEDILTKKLYRYLIAIRRVIEANDFLHDFNTTDGKVIQALISECRYNPMLMESGTDDFLKDFTMHFVVTERLLYGT